MFMMTPSLDQIGAKLAARRRAAVETSFYRFDSHFDYEVGPDQTFSSVEALGSLAGGTQCE
jgi:hypothetical protein